MSKDKSPLNMPKKPATKDWHRADIVAAVRKTGTSLQQLSLAIGLGRTTLHNALYAPCPKYERIIAEHLKTQPQYIWPSRYHLDGTPKSGRGERGQKAVSNKSLMNDTGASKSRNVYSINNRRVAA